MDRFTFPAWVNKLLPVVGAGALVAPAYAAFLLYYGTDPYTTNVGYMPQQPVPYSHALHVGQLGMDCRYCHNTVFEAGYAAIPPTKTCTNCHTAKNADGSVPNTAVYPEKPTLVEVRRSQATGNPIEWNKIHDLSDYVYFNHAAHVNRNVGCESCHGRIDQMEVVWQDKPLTMAWCLDCHRNPEPHLRPQEFITAMGYVADDQNKLGKDLREQHGINPKQTCATCHR